jgi:hypothetical protein
MDKDMLQRLASKSGASRSSGPVIPSVKLDASAVGETAGQFIKFQNKESTPIGNSLSIRILRIRKTLAGFVDEGGKEVSYNSSEYDSPRAEEVALYKRESGGESRVVEVATATELRERYPLKVMSIVYALLDGELIKFKVKGASAAGETGLYAYLDGLRDKNVLAFQVETLVTVGLIKKNRAVSYHHAEFRAGKEYTDGYDDVEKYLDMINEMVLSKKNSAVERKETVTTTVDTATEFFESLPDTGTTADKDDDVF